jgi:cysteine-rich repeat protein
MRSAAATFVFACGCNAILGIGDVKSSGGGADASPVDASRADGMPDGMPDAMGPTCGFAPSGSIVGCSRLTHVLSDGSTVVDNKDLSRLTFSALIPSGNTFTATTPGPGNADGTFRIDGVPEGKSYYLEVIDNDAGGLASYFYTDQRSLDLSYRVWGRPGAAVPDATNMMLNLTGMTPWQANDIVVVNSFNVGNEYDLTDPTTLPAAGATALTQTFDWRGAYGDVAQQFYNVLDQQPRLIDGPGHMDDVTVSHLTTTETSDNGGIAVQKQTIVDAYTTKSLAMTDGQAFPVSGAFSKASTGNPVQITLDLAALRGRANNAGAYHDDSVFITRFAYPGTGPLLVGPSLVMMVYDPDVSAPLTYVSSLGFPAVTYTNPFPATWSQSMGCEYDQHRHFLAPGAKKPTNLNIIQRFTAPAASVVDCTATMPVPTNIQLGGVDASTSRAVPYDGSAALTMTWDTVPNANQYQILVDHVTVDASGNPSAVFVATLNSNTNSVPLPAQLLVPGDRYIFKVIAYQTQGDYAHGQLLGHIMADSRTGTGLMLLSSKCGNGALDAGEQCDSKVDTATCNADCTLVKCGDGHVNTVAGEQCDNIGESPTCSAACKLPVCGDGVWNYASEQCDDGNVTDGDGCSHDCKLERCGTNGGVLDPGEQCDDGNRVNGDGCNAFCQIENFWNCDTTKTPTVCTHQ